MGRPAIPVKEKALRALRRDREVLQAELDEVAGYTLPEWEGFRQKCREGLARIDSAIRNVETNGLPDGWADRWGVS